MARGGCQGPKHRAPEPIWALTTTEGLEPGSEPPRRVGARPPPPRQPSSASVHLESLSPRPPQTSGNTCSPPWEQSALPPGCDPRLPAVLLRPLRTHAPRGVPSIRGLSSSPLLLPLLLWLLGPVAKALVLIQFRGLRGLRAEAGRAGRVSGPGWRWAGGSQTLGTKRGRPRLHRRSTPLLGWVSPLSLGCPECWAGAPPSVWGSPSAGLSLQIGRAHV